MNLIDYLSSIYADPVPNAVYAVPHPDDGWEWTPSVNIPPLLVRRDDLTKSDMDTVLGPTYNRRPYAIVLLLPANKSRTLNDGSTIMTRLVDIIIQQPSTAGMERPNRGNITRVHNTISEGARHFVRSISGHNLIDSLRLASEVGPDLSEGGGLISTIRFRAFHHRL